MRNVAVVSLVAMLAACATTSDRPGAGRPDHAIAVTALHSAAGAATFSRVFAPGVSTDDPAQALRAVLQAQGVADDVIATAVLENVQTFGRRARVAQFGQRIDDLDVFGAGMAIALDGAGHPVAISGSLVSTVRPKRSFVLAPPAAVARALVEMTGLDASAIVPVGQPMGGYTRFDVQLPAGSPKRVRSARVKPVWFDGKRVTSSYYVELDVGGTGETTSALRSFVVDATDGALLFTHDLVAHDAFSYRVFAKDTADFGPWPGPQGAALVPHPTGVPDATVVTALPANLVTLPNLPFSKNDPWLASDAKTTSGNNVDAYADLVEPDGFDATGDVRPDLTAPFKFDRAYDPTKNPNADQENIKATATQLFYVANWLHDWFYDAGFDEASRNHQNENLGRGGVAGDALNIEAQDYNGRNNADAATPADGGSPRVQMYLFNGQGKAQLTVTAPSTLAGSLATRAAPFGPANFDVTQAVVLVDDGSGTASDGCEKPFVNAAALKGKIALIDRGTCTFTDKVLNAEAAGAAGVLIANNVAGGAAQLGGTTGVAVKVPVLSMSQADGAALKAATAPSVRMFRETALDRDGGLDTSISAHEWGHVLSNRLVSNGNGLTNNQGGGMGEGWADFVALMTMLHASDVAAASKNGFRDVYPVGGWVYGVGTGTGSYFGLRRYPYSSDLTKNPLTFKHIQDGTALPKDAPLSFGESGSNNAEVHATGEVWSSMLWQCYTNLLRDTPRLDYAEANKRMRSYLVAGLKLTPKAPTFLEARDALLAAMYAADKADFKLCSKGFAERGAGVGAKGPGKASFDNVGVTESFVSGNDLEVVSVTLDPSTGSCDGDGVLDVGETGTLTIKLRNIGTDTLTGTTGKLTSTTGTYAFADGGRLSFPAFEPFQTVEATVAVTLQKAAPVSKQELTIALDNGTFAVPRTIEAKLPVVVDYDVAPASSAKDDVEDADSTWRATGNASLSKITAWKRVSEDANQRWSIVGNPEISDRWIVSPPLDVASDQPFGISFVHRHSFERDNQKRNWDGGVVEISVDDGATWVDAGASVYPGKLETKDSANPLKGRAAFVGSNAKYPAYEPVSIDLADAYAGKTVRVRFRFGTDEGTASVGWDVDDIAFTGITNTPFSARVPDATNPCGDIDQTPPAPTAEADPLAGVEAGGGGCGCSTPGTRTQLGGLAGLGGLALLSWSARRRRFR